MDAYDEITLGHNGTSHNHMDDDMMTEYYNGASFPNEDHAMAMMEEAENELDTNKAVLTMDSHSNDEGIAVSNEIMMEEYGEDGKAQGNNFSFASTSYSQPLDSDTVANQTEYADETIGEAVYGTDPDHIYQPTIIEDTKTDIDTFPSNENGNQSIDNSTDGPTSENLKASTEASQEVYSTAVQSNVDEVERDTEVETEIKETHEVINAPLEGIKEPAVVEKSHGYGKEENDHRILEEGEKNEGLSQSEGLASDVQSGQEVSSHTHTSIQPPSLRLTFNEQDFVLYSKEEPAAFISVSSDQQEEHIQAPILSIETKTFFEPLESFFEALRVREVLGDFLDDGTELCLSFPDLEMAAREDDVYVREVTLDDIQRLHSGMGHINSMHIKVSEGHRFISRYNELATHVSSLIERQTEAETVEGSRTKEEHTATATEIVADRMEDPVDTEDVNKREEIREKDTEAIEEEEEGVKGEEVGKELQEEETEEEHEDEGEDEETFVTVDGDQEENADEGHWQGYETEPQESIPAEHYEGDEGTTNIEDHEEHSDEKHDKFPEIVGEVNQKPFADDGAPSTKPPDDVATSTSQNQEELDQIHLHLVDDVEDEVVEDEVAEEEDEPEQEYEDEAEDEGEERYDASANRYDEEYEPEDVEKETHEVEDEESYDGFVEEDPELYEDTNGETETVETYDAEGENATTTSSIGLKRHHEDEEQYVFSAEADTEGGNLDDRSFERVSQDPLDVKRARYEVSEQAEE